MQDVQAATMAVQKATDELTATEGSVRQETDLEKKKRDAAMIFTEEADAHLQNLKMHKEELPKRRLAVRDAKNNLADTEKRVRAEMKQENAAARANAKSNLEKKKAAALKAKEQDEEQQAASIRAREAALAAKEEEEAAAKALAAYGDGKTKLQCLCFIVSCTHQLSYSH